jgi:hypothetical protein
VGVPHVRKKRREGKVTVREGLMGREVSVLGCLGPLPFFLFILLSLYSFLFSNFLYRFCILNPNKVKPLSKFL